MRKFLLSLVFAITAIAVQAEDPAITMTTSLPNGSDVEFYLASLTDNTTVQVDWGNGSLENFTIGQYNTTISGTTTGSTIKIYGSGITSLYASYLNLTSLNVSKATSLTDLTVSNNQLQSLDIAVNTNLQYLDCSKNQLETLSVTTNIKLEKIYCFKNKLTTIDITSNADLWELDCSNNLMTNLDFSSVTSDVVIDCSNNLLTSLTLGNNMSSVRCKNNALTNLDVSQNTSLYLLDCSNNQISTLNLSNNGNLQFLICTNNNLSSLDLSHNPLLTELYCTYNKFTFTTLPITNPNWNVYDYNPQKSLELPKNNYEIGESIELSSQLTVDGKTTNYYWKTKGGATLVAGTDYNVTGGVTTFLKVQTDSVYCEMTNATFPDLTLSSSKIKVTGPIPNIVMTTTTTIGSVFSFDLNAASNNTPIKVDWGNGSLVSYTINTSYSNVNGTLSGNTIKVYGEGITKLYLSSKNLTAFDVSGATQLTHLDCHSNQLTSLDVSKNTALVVLECYLNQLTSLDVSKNLALQELKCSINQLTSLDVTKNTSLKRLFCDSNQITTLDVSQNTALQDLYCDSNLLTSLDVTSNTLLQELLCFSNQLTNLDISKNLALKELWCYSNKLNSLDVSKNTALEFLFCESNQLDNLDLSQNTDLTEVRCHANNLTFSTLPIKETAWTTYIYSPQNVIKLSKKQYGLTETVDLSSELTVNSNNTNYTWKTKGGVTLTAGIDYNVTNGITTFLKEQADSVYCEMTNATFPDLTLLTDLVSISNDKPYFIMITTLPLNTDVSFRIAANNNTSINIDWGNGVITNHNIATSLTTIEGTTKGNTIKVTGIGINYIVVISCSISNIDVSKISSLKNFNCSNNNLTSIDISKNTQIQGFICNNNKLTTLSLENNSELINLEFHFNYLTSINLENNPKIKYLSCFYNNIEYLDVSELSSLEKLRCFNNKITSLVLPSISNLKDLQLENNLLNFATLPLRQINFTNYIYTPQAKLSLTKPIYFIGEEVDLRSQLSVGGNNTVYTWKTISGVTLVKDIDYTENNGLFTFLKQPEDGLYCEMRNETFPNLTLTTDYFSVTSSIPTITFSTSLPNSSQLELTLMAKTNTGKIIVDWGDGVSNYHSVSSSASYITGTLLGNTVKIYGYDISYIDISNKRIYSILINNPSFNFLNCKSNNLAFSTLPPKQQNWTTYLYSPQNAVKLSKKQYGLTETVDLSSELTVNGNTTSYAWKTKGGVTLTAGTDYNVTNGVTTFLKVQTDSVYCQMTNATFPELTLTTTNIKVSEYPLSVGDNEVAISVYPNPATEHFTIKMAEEIVRVEVYTITGVKVFENGLYSSTTVTVPLSSIPKGALLIKAYTRNGVYGGKVVKI